jgi:hypothetical protein
MSAMKKQQVLEMATRWDSMPPMAFVAHQRESRNGTMKTAEERSRKNICSIETSRTLSEKPWIINRCK